MNKKVTIVVVLVVLIGGIWFFKSKGSVMNDYTNNENETAGSETSLGMYAEENAVIISDQKPGNTLIASRVLLAAPGYLVVHENSGGPGAILGSSALLAKGEHEKVEVTLNRASKDGEKLFAMLHFEQNNNTTFEAASDKPVPSIIGGPLMAELMIDLNAEVILEVLP